MYEMPLSDSGAGFVTPSPKPKTKFAGSAGSPVSGRFSPPARSSPQQPSVDAAPRGRRPGAPGFSPFPSGAMQSPVPAPSPLVMQAGASPLPDDFPISGRGVEFNPTTGEWVEGDALTPSFPPVAPYGF